MLPADSGPPTPSRHVGRGRALRLVLPLALIAAAALAFLSLRPGRNLALHKPVTASSIRLGAPEGLVNGFVEYGGYALHTRTESPAWVRVDLGSPHRISEVRLYSRGDGFLDDRSAQLTVDLSEDGLVTHRAGRCAELFSQLFPCVIDARGQTARYVLVSHGAVLVLSEIEVIEAR